MKLYLLRMTGEGESFYKIGVTNQADPLLRFTKHGTDRIHDSPHATLKEKLQLVFAGHFYIPPYAIEFKKVVDFTLEGDALLTERDILDIVRPAAAYAPLIAFSGRTECFTAEDEPIRELVEFMDEQAVQCNAGAPPLEMYWEQYRKGRQVEKIARHQETMALCRRLGY